MADVSKTDITKTLRDAAYVAVGMGVLAFQKSQVRRVELRKQFEEQRKQMEAQAGDAREQLTKLVKGVEERWEPVLKQVEERWEPVIKQLESRLDELEHRLPEQAATVIKQTRAVAKDVQTELASRLTGTTSAA